MPRSAKVFATSRQMCTVPSANSNYSIKDPIHKENIKLARRLFDENPVSSNIVFCNSIIKRYISENKLDYAQEIFDQMPTRDVVTWNTMLSGFHKTKNPEIAYQYYVKMGREGYKPTGFTFSTLIASFISSSYNACIPQFHSSMLCLALNSSVFVGSALMRGYTDLGDRHSLCRVFDEILIKDVTSWNALIFGQMHLGVVDEGRRAFETMPEKNIVSWTTLVNGFIKNKRLIEARSVFDTMQEKNVISWTAMIRGYVEFGKSADALKLFILMLRHPTEPNHFTFSTVLEACAGCCSLFVGNQVHSCILKYGIPLDVVLSTSLVDMYAKCGDIEIAFSIFEAMSKKNLVAWNSIIGGCARHGLATRAVEEFDRMTKVGVWPDQITFINVLSACMHGGLVNEGEGHFQSMTVKYGIQPEMEHYACLVDLYGRAGQLDKAENLIRGMPFEPDVIVWGAFLGACGLHSCLELGDFAASGIHKLEQDHPAFYSMLSKIHGEKGRWGSVMELRKSMEKMHVRKQKAGSWVEC